MEEMQDMVKRPLKRRYTE